MERLVDVGVAPADPADLYLRLDFPAPHAARPYVFINMASTADGKIVVGEPGGPAAGVGGPTDQILFRRLQRCADAALIGGSTLRASQVIYPPGVARFVATRTGDLPLNNRFFTDAPGRAYVLVPEQLDPAARARLGTAATIVTAGAADVEWPTALSIMREDLGVARLLCEGGGRLNDQLIRAGLADELFLTIAPKLKGGAQAPTIQEGAGFPPGVALPLELLSLYRDGAELYLRYRMGREPQMYGRRTGRN